MSHTEEPFKFKGELYNGNMTQFKLKQNERDIVNPWKVDIKVSFDWAPGKVLKSMPTLNKYGATAQDLYHMEKCLKDAVNSIAAMRRKMISMGCMVDKSEEEILKL